MMPQAAKTPAIPKAALASDIAILGKKGSGKTVTAKAAAESLLDDGARVCALDPTGVWWGMKSSRDGKKAAYPIVIFGGEHADFPITRNHGAAIAELVGTSDMSCIIDTKQMTVSERTQFFTDFAETLLRRNKGPLHLIIDEAHVFMPQGRVNDPQSGKMLHAGNNLVSLGRSAGIRIIMISQRPAKLHKDSLTQVETLIAMRLIAPQDVNAVKDWIGEWADPKEGKDILQSLPSLKTGTGWIWSPEIGILKKCDFPMIRTYDSSRAPDADTAAVVLAKIDQKAIQSRLESVAQAAIENDPATLRAKIAELQRQLKAKTPVQAPAAVPDRRAIEQAVKQADQAGFARGKIAGFNEAVHVLKPQIDRLKKIAVDTGALADGIAGWATKYTAEAAKLVPAPAPAAMAVIPSRPVPAAVSRPPPNAPKSASGVSRPQQDILNALASLETLGVQNIKRNQVAAFAPASPKSSAFMNNLGRLRTDGYIDYPGSGIVCLTDAGRRIASYPQTPPTVADLQVAWFRIVTEPQARIISPLINAYPDAISREDLAGNAGASATSSAYMNNLGALRSLGVIDYPSKGMVIATDMLFPRLARAA